MKKLLLPPVLPALFTTIGAVVHFTLWRVEPLSAPWNFISGNIIVGIAVIMAVASISAFRSKGESLDVAKPTQNLVSDKIYATSRNPVYLSFLIFIVGIGCILNSLTIILAIIPSFAVLNWYTIPREERYLKRKLGAEYEEYLTKVRRWL